MRIVHLIVGLGDGGAEKSLYKLVTSDKSNSHSVISLKGLGKYGPLLFEAGIPVTDLQWNSWASLTRFVSLARFLRSIQPEILHAWMPHAALLSSLAKRLVGTRRLIWSIRASDYGSALRALPTRLIVRMLALLSHTSPDKILVVGERALEKHADLGFSRKKMLCIPNGYAVPDSDLFERRRNNPDAINTQRGPMVFGMLARYHPQKDHRNLLKAFSMVKKKRTDWVLKLAGEGVHKLNKELLAEVSRAGLNDKVFLLGPTPEPDEFFLSIDVHVLSSSFGEGFPNVVAESMLNEVPNLVTDVGDCAAIVGESGWVVNPSSAKDLSRAIESILECETAEVRARGLRARVEIQERYSLDQMVQSHVLEYLRH